MGKRSNIEHNLIKILDKGQLKRYNRNIPVQVSRV
jgi:hypothetical protein